MSSEKQKLVKFIYGKNNELESLKKYTKDEMLLKIIEAKQDTLTDMEKFINNEIIQEMLNL